MPRLSKLQQQLDKNYTPIIHQALKGTKGFPLSDLDYQYYNRPYYYSIYESLFYRHERFKLNNYRPSATTIWNAFRNLGEQINEHVKSNRQANLANESGLAKTGSGQGF